MGGADAAIELSGITKRFGDVVANDDIDLTVEQGTIHALLGENGAGKTTLMNVLYGLYQPDEGEVRLAGESVDFDSPADAIHRGIGMIHQHFMLVSPMTVAENIALGWEPKGRFGIGVDEAAVRRKIRELNEQYGFDVDPGATVESIGVGEQQRVEILKTMYRGADIFILDEPTAVLTPQEVDELFEILTELTRKGKTIIFITHKLGEVLSVADRTSVLRDGRMVDTVDTAAVTERELATMMVGRDIRTERNLEPTDNDEIVLSVSDLTVVDDRGVTNVDDVGFDVASGEIFGIAGVDGNGQSELVECITGLRRQDSGHIEYRGRDISGLSRAARVTDGIGFIPEDRQEQALILDFSLVKNAILSHQHRDAFADGQTLKWDRVSAYASQVIEEYDVRPPNENIDANSLSGGNQQKFVVGRELERDPHLVVAAHPTRGVDIGSVQFIHEQLMEMRRSGRAILAVSSKLDELQHIADRIGVMYDGRMVDIVRPEAVTNEEIGLLMAGEVRTAEAAERAVEQS